MSSAPDSTRMPYELSVEEIQIYVSPLLGLGNSKPRNRKWLKRWVLTNAEVVEFDGSKPVVVKGLRSPFDAQAIIRRELPPDVNGLMPFFYGDFVIRDTHFMITAVAGGSQPENSSDLPTIADGLLQLDAFFRQFWGERELPGGIAQTEITIKPLKSASRRLPDDLSQRLIEIAEELENYPLNCVTSYPTGLMHGDPGVDNSFISDEGVVFIDGPGEFGPEIVDLAYLMQSAAATLEDFDPEPTLKALAEHYYKPIDEFRGDMLIADILAHVNVIAWFHRCSAELLPEYDELYDHLIEDRIRALERLLSE